ncbi:MAG: PhzF family phenazine biosynthesis isomerase [Gammaproteobacteria bacterium]|nr:PhzF family phenazine biosynthesis isomerase [Gammaproteobacteria bacterium]
MVRLFHVDAFTAERFGGNPATVVLGADALDEATLRLLAREFGHGDSVFALPADAGDHDLIARFFTPRGEAAFIGHATVALHAALQALDPVAGTRTRRQKQQSGIVEVTTTMVAGTARYAVRQPPAPLGAVLDDAALAPVLRALALEPADLDPRCPAQVAGAGSTRLLIGLRDGARLAGLQADGAALARLSGQLGVAGFFLFSLRPARSDCTTEARMFCPAIGIAEDPVSGNAHGMLGVYLCQHGLLPAHGRHLAFTGRQGHHMGRGGCVVIEMAIAAGTVRAVTIVGAAAVVYQGQLTA